MRNLVIGAAALLTFFFCTAVAFAEDADNQLIPFEELRLGSAQLLGDKLSPEDYKTLEASAIFGADEQIFQQEAGKHFDSWKAANVAMGEALNEGDNARAGVAARAALGLYKERESQDLDARLTLIDNAINFLSVKEGWRATRYADTQFRELELVYDKFEQTNDSLIDAVTRFGLLNEATFFRGKTTFGRGLRDDYNKRVKSFWSETIDRASVLLGEDAEKTLLSRYLSVSYRRFNLNLRQRRRDFEKVLDACVEAKAFEPTLLSLSAWAGIALVQGKGDKTFKKLDMILHEDFADQTVPETYARRMLGMVSSGFFLKKGPEKTEALIRELTRDDKFEVAETAELAFNVAPMVRVEPRFMNIKRPERIVLEYSITSEGTVDKESISVLETTAKRLIKPAEKALAKWKYVPQFKDGRFVPSDGIRVAFSVTPPK